MQSIACIMVFNARCTLRLSVWLIAKTEGATSGASGWLQYAHIFASNICNSKERFRSTSGCLLFA